MSNNTMQKYGFSEVDSKDDDALVRVEESRATAEVQAAYVIAKRFPRKEMEAFGKIINACKRPFLAEQSSYAYPKGKTVVTGPSIRLAEVLLQYWGNCEAGVREIAQANGVSIAEAYAVDFETNTRVSKTFHVSHRIQTKSGVKILTDPREIYELVANYGARRMRACILAIIPGDISDAALDECKQTMINGKEPIADRIRKLVLAFDELGIKVEHIEKRLGHNIDAIIPQEIVTLGAIFKSIRDGMGSREDFFDFGIAPGATKAQISELIENKAAPNLEVPPPEQEKKK